ncbi:MAG: hypothetical protein ABI211_02445, partial [Vicinamibacterales bacterium]
VTLKDIVDLSKAGLGDEVLLALIDVDGGVFDVDPLTLKSLKTAGVSERVIVALVRSGRERPEVLTEPATLSDVVSQQAAPQVIYVERPSATVVREVAVPYPVYVGVPVSGRGRHEGRAPAGIHLEPSITAPATIQGRPRNLTDVPAPSTKEPVYWGNGGKLRPDAWKPQ